MCECVDIEKLHSKKFVTDNNILQTLITMNRKVSTIFQASFAIKWLWASPMPIALRHKGQTENHNEGSKCDEYPIESWVLTVGIADIIELKL
jgi:hypothetical protein